MADLLSLGGSALANVPDPTTAVNNQIAAQQTQAQNSNILQQQGIDLQNAQRAQQQAQATQAVLQQYRQNPTPAGLAQIAVVAPAVFDSIAKNHALQTTDQQNSELRMHSALAGQATIAADSTAPAASQAAAGQSVITMLSQRVDADLAAGIPSDADAAALAEARSGDFKGVLAASNIMLRGAIGPERYAEAYGAQTTGSEAPSVIAKNQADAAQAQSVAAQGPSLIAKNKADADQAEGTLYRSVKNADGSESVVAVGPAAGGQGSGATGTTGGDPDAAPLPLIYKTPVGQQMAAAARGAGATAAETRYLGATAQLESSGDPSAKNGKSTGLFQFHPQTFSGAGGGQISDTGDQTVAALKLARQNSVAMTQSLGRSPTAPEVYLAHQQGATGAAALIGAPDGLSAVAALQRAGVSPRTARTSIVNNGGTPDMPASAFVAKWAAKYNAAAGGPGDGAPGASAGSGARVVYQPSQSSMLTPEAIDQAAQQYLLTGEMPSTGMGETATLGRNMIMNRAAAIQAETGRTGYDAAISHAGFGAQQTALTNLTTMAAQVQASEGTVVQNMGIVQGLIPKGAGPTGSPLLNAPIQALRKNAWGSTDVAKLDGAIGTTADEYAKVMSSASGTGGPTTDSARNAAYERLDKAATPGQLLGVMQTMRQEMANRSASINAQMGSVQSMMRGSSGAPQGAPVAAGGQPLTPQQAVALPPGTSFRTTDGRVLVRH